MKFKTAFIVGSLLTSLVAIEASAQDRREGRRGGPDVAAFADGDRAQRRPGRPRGRNPERLIERLDQDGDGLISEFEYVDNKTANMEDRFDQRDGNGDGVITEDELGGDRDRPGLDIDIAELRACIADSGGEVREEIDRFDIADLDDDGQLSFLEFSTFMQDRAFAEFARLDADMNGFVSADELTADADARREQRDIVRSCREELSDAG